MAELKQGTSVEINPTHATNPSLQALFDYWNLKRVGRLMLARRDLVVSEIKEHLGWVSLLDVLDDRNDFRYRLIGTRVTAYFSSDTTGKSVSEAFSQAPEAGSIMLGRLRHVVGACMPIRTFGNLAWLGRDLEDFESLFLPFSEDNATVSMIMNPFVFDGPRVFLNRQIQRESQN